MKPNIVVVSASLVLLFALAATVGADRTPPDIVQASKVIGKAVVNAEGRSIGSIEDLAIDELDGQIRYAVLSFGGVLGMGESTLQYPGRHSSVARITSVSFWTWQRRTSNARRGSIRITGPILSTPCTTR